MASSSSAKKVARVAAKSGSGKPAAAAAGGGQRNWLFALAIVVIVGLGIGVVAFARDQNVGLGDNSTPPRANLQDGNPSDHWHAAFAISVCGNELAALQDGATDPLGIHTHGDGLIHIHPFTRTAAGERATMERYFGQVGLKVTNSGFQLPDGLTTSDGGTTVVEGETTCAGEEGELVMARWESALDAGSSDPDEIIRDGFGSVRFREDGAAYTLAFVPKGSTSIAPPSTAAEIESLGAVDAAPTATGTEGDIPIDTSDVTVETVVPEETTTTAATSEETTTTAAADAEG